MKKGPSFYYASDKNIFDAITQSRVDQDTVQKMFGRRNIVCSKQTDRDDLADFFSRLTHDYLDHEDLSKRLGIVRRQEKVTALDLKGEVSDVALAKAIDKLKKNITDSGDTVQLTKNGSVSIISIGYTEMDFRRNEFSQMQKREGYIEIFRQNGELIIRSTQAKRIGGLRDLLIRSIEKDENSTLERFEVSLFHHHSHKIRSKFFYDLFMELPGFVRRDVTDVYVYKPKPNSRRDEDQMLDEEDTHVEKVFLRGKGISQSNLLRDLIQDKSYYIVRIGWTATEILGRGFGFDIEAMFQNASDCTGFSYILHGVYEMDENGKLMKKRRSPTTSEIDMVARAIEERSRQLIKKIDSDAGE